MPGDSFREKNSEAFYQRDKKRALENCITVESCNAIQMHT